MLPDNASRTVSAVNGFSASGSFEQLQGRDQESSCAEPALKAAALGECPAQPGRLLELVEPLDGVDPQAVDLNGQRQAGPR